MKIPTVQLALDCSSTEEAIRDCQTGVVDEVDILECGYSLIAAEGARVVKIFREMYPNKPLLADLKIVDAGSKIGGMLLDGRPDFTTILCACEPGTITSVQAEAKNLLLLITCRSGSMSRCILGNGGKRWQH